MSSDLDVEQLQTTKSEKLLALVLAVFLLIGGLWAYQEIDDKVRSAIPGAAATQAEREALRTLERAQQRLFLDDGRVRTTRAELELRREAYRTALDAGDPAGALRARYLAAQTGFEQARTVRQATARAEQAARPAATAARKRIDRDGEKRRDRQELVTFILRTAAALLFLLAGYLLLTRLRDKASRWFPLSASVVLFATVFAFVVAVDYLTDYFDPFDAGILLLSLLGAAATLVAFWLLQRYLARRLPRRRIRRHQCPHCGFPVADNPRCEGCGHEVHSACAHCGGLRRVRAPFCGACGKA